MNIKGVACLLWARNWIFAWNNFMLQMVQNADLRTDRSLLTLGAAAKHCSTDCTSHLKVDNIICTKHVFLQLQWENIFTVHFSVNDSLTPSKWHNMITILIGPYHTPIHSHWFASRTPRSPILMPVSMASHSSSHIQFNDEAIQFVCTKNTRILSLCGN